MRQDPVQNNINSSPKIELNLGEMKKKCDKEFQGLMNLYGEEISNYLNGESKVPQTIFEQVSLEENIELLKRFLSLIRAYHLIKLMKSDENKKEEKLIIEKIANLF